MPQETSHMVGEKISHVYNRRLGSRMYEELCKQFKRGRQHNRKIVHFTKEEIHVVINI